MKAKPLWADWKMILAIVLSAVLLALGVLSIHNAM
jgi:hypothetical protein